MPTCASCESTVSTDDLVRHERDGFLFVHCPECHCCMGHYRDPCVKPE
ncbi:hypothetical protein [Haloarchaeobius sp. DFWS5]